VPQDAKKRMQSEYTEKAKADGKPDSMVTQIVEGQVKKYFAEKCLLDQLFIKNPDKTVGEVVKEANAQLGENIVVRRFSRLVLGEIN
jgi:elongation factor Ts